MKQLLDVLGPAYARSPHYWKALFYSGAMQGILLGAVALGFINLYTVIAKHTWLVGAYAKGLDLGFAFNITLDSAGRPVAVNGETVDITPFLLGNGEWWLVLQLFGAGVAVGILKVLWTLAVPEHPFPDRIPGFIKDMCDLHSEDVILPVGVLAASAISIGLGASVGPEAALGAAGAGFGTFIAKRWSFFGYQARSRVKEIREQEEQDNNPTFLERFFSNALPDFSQDVELCTLDGMAACFGGIFPSQFISPMLIHEVGNHWGPGGRFAVTETVARTGIAATFAYGLYIGIEKDTLLHPMQLPFAFYDVNKDVPVRYLAYGGLIGVITGLVGFVGFVILGVCGAIGMKVTEKMNVAAKNRGFKHGLAGKLFAPMIGGAILGGLYIVTPLNLGEGSDQMGVIFSYGSELGLRTLIVTALFKFLAVGISLGFGFIGGPFFPFIFAGGLIGSSVALIVPAVPVIISYSCGLVGVLAAFFPSMFTLTVLVSTMFVLGGPLTAPIFVAAIMSYSVVCGLGLIQNLLLRAMKMADAEQLQAINDGEIEEGASDTFNPLMQSAYSGGGEDLPVEADDSVSPEQISEDGADDDLLTAREDDEAEAEAEASSPVP